MNRRQIEHTHLLALTLNTAMVAAYAQREHLSEDSDWAAAHAEKKIATYAALVERLEVHHGIIGEEASQFRMLDSDITNGDLESAGRIRSQILADHVREFARGDELDELIHQLVNHIRELNYVVDTLKEVRGA